MLSLMLPHADRRRATTHSALALLCLFAAGCAASTAVRHGREAEHQHDYDRAVVEYTKALRLRPDDADARLGLDRAKLRASDDHFTRGRRLAAVDKPMTMQVFTTPT